MGIKAILDEISDAAKMDGRAAPLITTDRTSARILAVALAHELGCAPADLRPSKLNLPAGIVAMYDDMRIAFFTATDNRDPVADVLKKVASMESTLMTVSDEVKSLLDLVAQEKTMVTSVDAGMKALMLQVANLQSLHQAMPAGTTLSEDDHAALIAAGEDLQTSIKTLQNDIPTNVTSVGTIADQKIAAADPEVTKAAATQHEADAAAAQQARPMGGGGAPAAAGVNGAAS